MLTRHGPAEHLPFENRRRLWELSHGCGSCPKAAGAAPRLWELSPGCGSSVGDMGMCQLFPGTTRRVSASCL